MKKIDLLTSKTTSSQIFPVSRRQKWIKVVNIYRLFTGREVRIGKNCAWGLRYRPRPQAEDGTQDTTLLALLKTVLRCGTKNDYQYFPIFIFRTWFLRKTADTFAFDLTGKTFIKTKQKNNHRFLWINLSVTRWEYTGGNWKETSGCGCFVVRLFFIFNPGK